MKDEDSYWKYAVLKENKIIISNNSVGVSVPVNLNIVSSQEMISASGLNERLNERMPEVNKSDQAVSQKAGSALGSLQSTGTLKVIVVRVEFPDKKMQVSSNLNYFNQILNSTGGAKDYFAEASYGKLTVNFDISQKVYSLPFSASYYSNPETSLIVNNAMNSANADIDFSQYDAVIVVHAGAGEEITANPFDYWSQR
ncbi:MAG TPA: hypothetical protein VI894_02040, partial [Candidatus Nanoarchaeia archaeon]|nr:hypothetical protein [Candidatus Nanoarchaeia archaeon]